MAQRPHPFGAIFHWRNTQRFSEENLVHVDGRHVVATTYREFVEGLYAREEFPPVQNFWQEIR